MSPRDEMLEQRRARMLERVESIHDIPTLPHVISKLNRLLRAPHSTAQQVGEVINSDQALASKTLKLVNSPYYGFGGKVQDIKRAIVILGFNKIRNLALSVSVVDMFKDAASEVFDFPAFWEHSIGTAVMCETIANVVDSSEIEDAFVSGLLHDLGKLVLVVYFTKEYGHVLDLMEDDELFSHEAERKLLGLDHGEIGAVLAQSWNFPEKLVRAIGYHNRPARTRQHRELAFLVHIAQFFSACLLVGDSGERALAPYSRDVWEYFEFDKKDVDGIFREFTINFKRAQEFFGLLM